MTDPVSISTFELKTHLRNGFVLVDTKTIDEMIAQSELNRCFDALADRVAKLESITATAPLDTTRQIAPSIVDARHAPVPPLTDEQKENLARSLSEVRVQEQTSPVDAGGEDDAQEIVNRIHLGTTRQCDAARIANIIAALRASLADAERRADEMEGKAGEWVAVDVHKERVESARADAVAMNKRLLGERDAAWKENARMLARVAELELRDVELVKSAQNAQAMVLKLNNTTLADLAAERERREEAERIATFHEVQAQRIMLAEHQAEKERDAARAEVAALISMVASNDNLQRTR